MSEAQTLGEIVVLSKLLVIGPLAAVSFWSVVRGYLSQRAKWRRSQIALKVEARAAQARQGSKAKIMRIA